MNGFVRTLCFALTLCHSQFYQIIILSNKRRDEQQKTLFMATYLCLNFQINDGKRSQKFMRQLQIIFTTVNQKGIKMKGESNSGG